MDADDCVSGVCIDGACAAPTCADEVRNGSESAVDCGGSCQQCPDGQGCNGAADCASGVCAGNAECVPASCADESLNGDETDIDCGGACEPCGDGEICKQGSDCASGVCAEPAPDSGAAGAVGGDLECQASTCLDGVRNGFEADVDCGGSECEPCGDGATCRAPADCASRVCTDDKCVPAECGDGVINGTEYCDDGNRVTETCAYGRTSCTVCDARCNEQLGATAYCGDGTVNGGEQCDNGVNDGTGCTPGCIVALRARVLLHCDTDSAVLQTLESTPGCYNLSANSFSQGPSYILLDAGTHATIYQGTDCTGTFAYLTQDTNFCSIAGMNDNVRSVWIGTAP